MLWSPDELATTSGVFQIEFGTLASTYNFLIDNKPFRRKMWAKVV